MSSSIDAVQKFDSEIATLMKGELARQQDGLAMIPSENYPSIAVMQALGTVLNMKYAEGYPGKRYYSGHEFIDPIETIAIERAKALFQAEHANVQPHSGSGANMACYMSIAKPGDKILGFHLAHGGHLTHGNPVNFSGKTYNFVNYGVDQETETIDMDKVRKLAELEKPKVLLSGTTAYPRSLDFKEFSEIAKDVGAYAMADISHIVGLCLAGVHQNPVPNHDIVMTTTTKTLRGPRSAIILSKKEDRLKEKYRPEEKRDLARIVDWAVFPGTQGGPLEHVIAAKAIAFKEAMQPDFLVYQRQIAKNAKALAQTLMDNGLRLVTGGTDTHLMIIDCRQTKVGAGKEASLILEKAGIFANMNSVPYDTAPPLKPSGLRLGTPALTTRGMKEKEMQVIAEMIAKLLNDPTDELAAKTKHEVLQLTKQFPLYPELEY